MSQPDPARPKAPLSSYWPLLWVAVVGIILLAALAPWRQWFQPAQGRVVVYAAQDQVYAEPVLKEFFRQTGIKPRAVYDSEAVKTVGLANRLLAETNQPQCDLFWGNEELRTRQLAARGVFRATNAWAAFGFRSRRIVINTNKVARLDATTELYLRELTNQTWRGKVALAYPLFGTTATYFHALRQYWGTERWEQWCRALLANQPLVVDGNSIVVNLVGRGEAWIGLTDSDDVAAGKKRGLPIKALPLTAETLLIPNTVALVRGGPNPREAEALFQFLQSTAVTEALLSQDALEGSRPGLRPHLRVDWAQLLRDFDDTNERLRRIFLR